MEAQDYFVIIPDHVVNRVGTDISQGAFMLYIHLVQLTRFINSASVQVGHAELGEKLGISSRRAKTFTKELELAGLVVKHAQKDPKNPAYNLENIYQVVVKNISPGSEENFTRGSEENFTPPIKSFKENIKANASASTEASFESLWRSYPAPRKGSKKDALSKYRTALKRYSASKLEDFMAHYINTRSLIERSGEFVPPYPYLTTWLNQERWNDFKEYGTQVSSEPTRKEMDKVLGFDNWRMPTPPSSVPPEQIIAWESEQKKKHWEERKALYQERIGDGKQEHTR